MKKKNYNPFSYKSGYLILIDKKSVIPIGENNKMGK